MKRIHFVVEGQTEETFVRDVLAPDLGATFVFCDAHRITTGRKHGRTYRGGFVRYDHLRNDLTQWMRQDSSQDSWFTTMIDLYALPPDFPGLGKAGMPVDPLDRVRFLEEQLATEINHPNFRPYIQLHEFEAILFSDPQSFSATFPYETSAIKKLEDIRRAFATPEHIDNDVNNTPSKRICDILPAYVKALHGPVIASRIGLPKIRRECPHFSEWIDRLQAL